MPETEHPGEIAPPPEPPAPPPQESPFPTPDIERIEKGDEWSERGD